MYVRPPENKKMKLPENYRGNAFGASGEYTDMPPPIRIPPSSYDIPPEDITERLHDEEKPDLSASLTDIVSRKSPPLPESKPEEKPVEIKDTTKIFTDVKAKKWYTNAVNYAYSHGFIAGVSDTEFGRDVPVTRGMFITILARIAGVDTSSKANKVTTKFTDVKSGKYYTNAIKWASENGDFTCTTDVLEAAKDADVLYTDVWASMGQEAEAEERKKIFKGYQINDDVMAVAKPDAMVLHCLPAHREEEITNKVFEAHAKEIFEEAENRLHAQKAVLVKLMKD
jgi:hypothetical protein